MQDRTICPAMCPMLNVQGFCESAWRRAGQVRECPHKKMRKAVSNLFQSTLPRRERRGRHDHQRRGGLISIHAPAKGATSRFLGVPPPLDFNPRSREGSDGGK